MKQYTTEKGTEILFVEVPEDADNLNVVEAARRMFLCFALEGFSYGFRNMGKLIKLPDNDNWELVGRLSEITEDQAKNLVEGFGANGYLNYINKMPFHEYLLKTATESLNSLAASLNVKDNVVVLIKNK